MFFTVSIFTFQAIHQAQPNPARQFKPLACRFWTVKGNICWPFFSVEDRARSSTSIKNQNWTRRGFLSCYSGLYCSTVYTSILYIYRPWRYSITSVVYNPLVSVVALLLCHGSNENKNKNIYIMQVITVAASCSFANATSKSCSTFTVVWILFRTVARFLLLSFYLCGLALWKSHDSGEQRSLSSIYDVVWCEEWWRLLWVCVCVCVRVLHCALAGAQVHAVIFFCCPPLLCMLGQLRMCFVCLHAFCMSNRDTCHDVCSRFTVDGSKVVVSVK